MKHTQQTTIKATYMRGGTSKGLFFCIDDLPKEVGQNKILQDKILMRIVGSPDPYGKQIDGMGAATSSTSKVVIVGKSSQPEHDVDYYFGQVSIDKPFIDWSGNCGNLSSAVGPFAITSGLIDKNNLKKDGIVKIRIWQANIKKTILSYVKMKNGQVQEIGDYYIDGVAFGAPEIKLEFVRPVDPTEALFPTGNLVDKLEVPNIGVFETTMITAGIPTVFLYADSLGYKGTELQEHINQDKEALKKFETIRAYASLKMGLIKDIKEAQTLQHTPKIAFVSKKQSYTTSSGKQIAIDDIDLNVRALSMGLLHHAMMGTASVAIGVAACIKGTILNNLLDKKDTDNITFGHPSGTLKVGAVVEYVDGKLVVQKASMSRSARVIMSGYVHIPHIK